MSDDDEVYYVVHLYCKGQALGTIFQVPSYRLDSLMSEWCEEACSNCNEPGHHMAEATEIEGVD